MGGLVSTITPTEWFVTRVVTDFKQNHKMPKNSTPQQCLIWQNQLPDFLNSEHIKMLYSFGRDFFAVTILQHNAETPLH